MKKLIMSLVASMFVSATVFGATNLPTTEKWNGEINTYKLAQYLRLSSDQSDEVNNICDYFATQMRRANYSKKRPNALLRNAVLGNMKLMKQVLTPEQYTKYAAVMNVTLVNKGIDVNKVDEKANVK